MAKPSTSSRASRNAPQHRAHRYIDALFTDDFGRQSKLTTSSANGFARKKLDAAAQSLQLKGERHEKQLRRIEIREWRAAERSVAAELRESDHRARLLRRSLRTKVRPEKKIRHTPPRERKRHWPYAAVALPKYDGPVIDRRGQRGVFMRMRYYSRRTAEAGVSQRVVLYCFNGAELDPDGNPYVATNIGMTVDEALCGFDHLEQVNWAAQKNAKLLMHGILAVDHRQSPDEMMTCGVRWAEETLGRFDLPYLVTLHAPPPDGDQRNWHLHVLWSFRPMVRTGDHEWYVGEMLRTDLDNLKAMKLFREMYASVMTEMSFKVGQNQVWTAKSNADRGLPHEPQVHLGGARTNQARSGEYVAENEENHERVMRSKAAVIDDALRHADEALARAQDTARAIAARFARLPALPMRVPERIVAATMVLDAPAFGAVPRVSTAVIVTPELPPATAERAQVIGSFEPPQRGAYRLSSVGIATGAAPRSIPRAAHMGIANLRIRPLPGPKPVMLPAAMPVASAQALAPTIPHLPTAPSLRLAKMPAQALRTPIVPRPIVLQLPALTLAWAPPILADFGRLDRAILRAREAQRRDDERRKREAEMVVRAAREARAVADQAIIDRRSLEAATAAAEPRGSKWQAARALRQRALAGWDETKRSSDAGLARPGRMLPQPGADRSTDQSAPTRNFPRPPGQGIGD
ncbi:MULTISPECIES: hypothetical protein [Sphingomonas]|jgi:hypothetical protein|uniref:MobA/MobL protein domain-containing protein n=1 Tax=Sphingomonas hankookensis TaxID=563996 RepID=A0ABR5Y9D4_9SPHN|nr:MULTISPECIES: hypothetical protein [Sphingomonas]KZE11222.1 hypothetical protein AVT10_17175 [Sphingomonas hankookensis]PZT95077.1 MAG: hypothetical protein DI625_06065 [Sphingomonas sp.]